MTLTIDLVAHMEAGDRNSWPGDQNARPLGELGRRQALAIADAMAAEPVDALYAGRALRCRQSIEPLAERLGLRVGVLVELGEDVAWRVPRGWEAGAIHEAPFAAGVAMRGIEKLRTLHPEGRIVACSHGHVIPALVSYVAALHGLDRVAPLERRGQWYRLRLAGGSIGAERLDAGAGFPG